MTTVTYLRTSNKKSISHALKVRMRFIDWYYSQGGKARKRPMRAGDIALMIDAKPQQVKRTMIELGWVAIGTYSARWVPPADMIEYLNPDEEQMAYATIMGMHPFLELLDMGVI